MKSHSCWLLPSPIQLPETEKPPTSFYILKLIILVDYVLITKFFSIQWITPLFLYDMFILQGLQHYYQYSLK